MTPQTDIEEWEAIQLDQRMERYWDSIELQEAQEDLE